MTTRLQGKEFREMIPELALTSYTESLHGNICCYFKRKGTKRYYKHWLNDDEKKSFEPYKNIVPKRVFKDKRSEDTCNEQPR
jgi:hypothetical protein